jgi:hypothetical protein
VATRRWPGDPLPDLAEADPVTAIPNYDSRVVGADECLHGRDGSLKVFFLEANDGSGGGCQGRYPTP